MFFRIIFYYIVQNLGINSKPKFYGGYILGRERFGKYDNEAVKRLEEIQKMDANSQSKLFDIIDTYIRDSKARAAYGA
ncbi:hypothetical protein [Flammeovirga kamogawensis]|uniref:Uncharacterized protein n=1 Tax=Flammeovirga kamogawensis TaxID=373891 RepID=A0ABX8H4K7_9BACT|nr:hypothetical protein [Flammeovirga kamogawensis]MBB6461901.1 hypothetical protein [Flammeovirga kamogawensis]QWG10487.1 hypothetical protein KM029_26290 [Flammeovirga kamogawensis]TRX63597.1 hypothetical protein EO216_24570 [Flammeovirga kamogawensis]